MRPRRRPLKSLNARVAPELHKALKQLSRTERVPMERIVESALLQHLTQHKEQSNGT